MGSIESDSTDFSGDPGRSCEVLGDPARGPGGCPGCSLLAEFRASPRTPDSRPCCSEMRCTSGHVFLTSLLILLRARRANAATEDSPEFQNKGKSITVTILCSYGGFGIDRVLLNARRDPSHPSLFRNSRKLNVYRPFCCC